MTAPSARTPRQLADVLVEECFGPPRPDAFEQLTTSERAAFVFRAFATAFPDAEFDVAWCTSDAERVAMGGTVRGTHLGPWRGVPATGRTFEAMSVVTALVVDGKVAELSVVSDSLAMAEQLEVVEPVGPKSCKVFDAQR